MPSMAIVPIDIHTLTCARPVCPDLRKLPSKLGFSNISFVTLLVIFLAIITIVKECCYFFRQSFRERNLEQVQAQ